MALGKLYQLGGMERSSVYAFKEVLKVNKKLLAIVFNLIEFLLMQFYVYLFEKECPLALEAIEGLLNLRLSGAEVQSFVLECAAQKGIGNIDW